MSDILNIYKLLHDKPLSDRRLSCSMEIIICYFYERENNIWHYDINKDIILCKFNIQWNLC